jgi:hypothetical protein
MTDVVSRAEAEAVVGLLRSTEVEDRRRALDELRAWQRSPFDIEAASVLISAATSEYPEVNKSWPPRPNERMVNVLWFDAQAVPPDVIAEHLPGLPTEARWAAIRLLAENGSEMAAMVLASELRRLAQDDEATPPHYPILLPFERDPRHAGTLIPAVLELLASSAWTPVAAGVLLPYAAAGFLTVDDERVAADLLRSSALGEMEGLRVEFEASGRSIRWDEESDHGRRRSTTGLVLDLIGHLRRADVAGALHVAAEHSDPWFALWGTLGLLRRGEAPAAESVARAAADPEARVVLYDQLASTGWLELMPDSERTQSKLAEGEMVRWLMFPTELGRAPDEIEEVAVVAMRHEAGPADLYVFKFRCHEPHWSASDGWMVGVAGPYLRREQPTSQSLNATFSRFEPYQEEKLRERVEAIVGTLAEWASAHGQAVPGSVPRRRWRDRWRR